MNRIRKIGALALVVVVGVVAILEIATRVVSIPGLRLEELDPGVLRTGDMRTVPHPYLGYALGKGWKAPADEEKQVSHNSLGFRGPEVTWEKPPGAFRIVCVGGSSVYGTSESADRFTWPAQLQVALSEARPGRKIEVINGGAPGYSTFEALVNLEFRLLDFQPDLVIVYEEINDMRCALWPDPVNDNSHWRAPWPVDRPSTLERWLQHSRTYLILRRYCTHYLSERRDLGYWAIVGYDAKVDGYVKSEPSMQGFHNYRRNLNNIISLVESRGAKVLLATQALNRADLNGAESMDVQLASFDRMTLILRQVAKERGVAVVETANAIEDAMRKEQAEHGRQHLFFHEVHLTDAGSRLLARTFADAILAGGYLL